MDEDKIDIPTHISIDPTSEDIDGFFIAARTSDNWLNMDSHYVSVDVIKNKVNESEVVERLRKIVFYEFSTRDTLVYDCGLGHISMGDIQDLITMYDNAIRAARYETDVAQQALDSLKEEKANTEEQKKIAFIDGWNKAIVHGKNLKEH